MTYLFSKSILLLLLFSFTALSEVMIGLDYILFTDANTVEATTSTKSSKTLYSINLQFAINQKKSVFLGWALYNVATKDDVNQQQSNYATQDMGPSLRYIFGRRGLYFLNVVYGVQTKTAYDSGGTSENWLGTNTLLQLGVSPEVSENFFVNFSFNYFNGAAKTKVVSSTQTDVSYSKAFMTPTVGMSYRW